MRLPINIEELLDGRAVEGDRIEYKTGWNPDAIYRRVCAFANDFDETGGGYIVVGVKEVNGRPVRPVVGIDPNQIEPIEKDMVGFNNLMQPYYHTIPMEAVREGKSLRSRRYRNRRLGEFLKELDLTEGRATGIPTIQDELKANGSPRATIETDEERTYFLIDIPCHPEFLTETLLVEQIGVKDGVKGGVKEPNVTKDVTKDVTKELTERQLVILEMITEDSFVTIPEMSLKTGVATRTIKRDIEDLQQRGILTRKGGRKDGEWIVTELGQTILEALKKYETDRSRSSDNLQG